MLHGTLPYYMTLWSYNCVYGIRYDCFTYIYKGYINIFKGYMALCPYYMTPWSYSDNL